MLISAYGSNNCVAAVFKKRNGAGTEMEIRVLKYFLMVAREENFTRASELLHITQPTLSRQMMQLEEELNVQLFVRDKHSVSLTEDGMLLRRRAEEIVLLADRTQQEMQEKYSNLSGNVTIGCGETAGMHVLSECMRTFRMLHPAVSFHVYTATADEVKCRLEKGVLDLGLVTEPVALNKYEFIRLPAKEKWGCLVQEESPLAKKKSIRPSDLMGIPIIIAGRDLVKNEIASWFGPAFEKADIAATYNLLMNASVMSYNGVGAAICTDVAAVIQGMKFVPLNPPMETGCAIIWKRHQANSTLVESFLSHISKSTSEVLEQDTIR